MNRLLELSSLNLLPKISDKVLDLEYKYFEDLEIHDLIMRVGSSPEEQFVQTYWELLFVPSSFIAIVGYALLIFKASWWASTPGCYFSSSCSNNSSY